MEIQTPEELTAVIKLVQASVAEGSLEEMPPRMFLPEMAPFMSVAETGPWDDTLFYEFRCRACGNVFQLSVEVYHAPSGGHWVLIKRSSQ